MDFRLFATDMDGTLLDSQGRIPTEFWPLLAQLQQRDLAFAPASGRQLATLQSQFSQSEAPLTFIAENGAVVARGDEIIGTTPLNTDVAHDVIEAGRQSALGMSMVICDPERAYVESTSPEFYAEVSKYYLSLEQVDDIHDAVSPNLIKMAVFSAADSETALAPALRPAVAGEKAVVSGKHWVDIMSAKTNKGDALRTLQEALGLKPENVVAFGDFLNDIELLQAAGTGYAMANAHPDVLRVADKVAPSNAEHGVIQVLRELLK